jgi:hypothetical protein
VSNELLAAAFASGLFRNGERTQQRDFAEKLNTYNPTGRPFGSATEEMLKVLGLKVFRWKAAGGQESSDSGLRWA